LGYGCFLLPVSFRRKNVEYDDLSPGFVLLGSSLNSIDFITTSSTRKEQRLMIGSNAKPDGMGNDSIRIRLADSSWPLVDLA
jgi:hypothetical protein